MDWAEFFKGAAMLVTAFGVAYVAVIQARQSRKLDSVADKVEVVRHETNSMKDQLVEEVRKSSFAKGVKSETDKK